jgi:hypothetical protein
MLFFSKIMFVLITCLEQLSSVPILFTVILCIDMSLYF